MISKKKEPKPRRTITFAELERLSFCNSRKLPQLIEIAGERRRWIVIGWVSEGKPRGTEVLVVE